MSSRGDPRPDNNDQNLVVRHILEIRLASLESCGLTDKAHVESIAKLENGTCSGLS